MRKICVVTGTRADYGLLYWLLKELHEDAGVQLQIIVTGMHLDEAFGCTYRAIERDGFEISEKVAFPVSSSAPLDLARSLGLATSGIGEALARLKPDLLVVLGDRYEILAAAQAAMVLQIPIAHLHGGESTEGLIDEAIRHAVTKMSHLHFVAAEEYRRRVIQLGESPERVHLVGAMGLEYVRRAEYLSREAFAQKIGFEMGDSTFMLTYHPVTLDKSGPAKAVDELLAALDKFPSAKIIMTKANSDTFGDQVNALLEKYCANNKRAKLYSSLGSPLYLSALKHVDVVLGNSSSGIIEAPALRRPTVNIGERQAGRLRASSVIDCREERNEIAGAIQKALSPEFQASLSSVRSPYGEGYPAKLVKDVIKGADLSKLLMKHFYSGPEQSL